MIGDILVLAQLVAITHVTVVDVEKATSHRDLTVLTDGQRITAVGPAESTRVPVNARVLDGRGKWLIPGLWDMHVHTAVPTGRMLLSLYVANGVTGVRDMGGDLTTIKK